MINNGRRKGLAAAKAGSYFALNCVRLAFFFTCFSADADPWGKDATLVEYLSDHPVEKTEKASPLARWGEAAIRFHQEVISPADGPRSHFIPSSSQYTLEAMQKFGFFAGYAVGCDRLMRENGENWVYRKIFDPSGNLMKWDPVP